MSIRIKYDINSDFVEPKLEDLDIETISLNDYKLIAQDIPSPPPNAENTNENDEWFNWTFSLSFEGIDTTVQGAEKFFEEVDRITAQITQLLKIIRLLSGNVNAASSFLKFTIKKLTKELKEFIDSLTSTGLYSSFIIPDFDKKYPKYVIPTYGGYQEFIRRVNNTCLNSKDPDAPKFEEADKVGGFIIAMLGGVNDPEYLSNLIENFKRLCEMFGLEKPYPSPARKVRAIPGFYKRSLGSDRELGVKITWEAPEAPVDRFFIYKTDSLNYKEEIYTIDGVDIKVRIFTENDPIAKVKYIPGKALYSYTDFDFVIPDKLNYYKIYSVYDDDFLERNPNFKSVNSPVASQILTVNVPKNCIPMSELDNAMNLAYNGEILSPFDLAGEWQSATVRRMLGNPIDSAYRGLDALSDKLIGMVETGSGALNSYLKFYGERIEALLEVIQRFRDLSIRLSSFTQRGTFMVLRLPLENGGMRGFVDRFNKACNSGQTQKNTPKNKQGIKEFLSDSARVQKNAPIAQFNDRGIMFGLIVLYGIPDLTNRDRLKDLMPEGDINGFKARMQVTEKAITTLLKMLGLE